MFTKSARVYDAIFESQGDFPARAEQIRGIVVQYVKRQALSLLDVACGTGAYLAKLQHAFAAEGLDIEPEMLAVAREKCPGVPLHRADMVEFDLARRFDVVVCLGSSIGYARTLPRLQQAARTFARHTEPDGIAIVEPWFGPDIWEDGRVTADLHARPDVKIARMLFSGRSDRISTLDIHYLIGRREGVESFVEHHELGLFTVEEYSAAFREAGFEVSHDPIGLMGRGLYVGLRQ